jgi:hypothetical protein
MFEGAPNHPDRLTAALGQIGVLLQKLGEAADGVERRAEFVAEPAHIAGLGEVRGHGRLLGGLERGVRPRMRANLG